MTSTVILFVRLVHSPKKKLIFPSQQDFIDCVRDPQWSTADNWLGSWNDRVAKMKELCLPLESSLKRSLPSQNTELLHDKQMSNLPAALQEIPRKC